VNDGSLPPLDGADLLVINAGGALGAPADDRGRSSLLAHVAGGRPILAMHSATAALPNVPEWPGIVGGRWVDGTSSHPPLGLDRVEIVSQHPIVRGVGHFTLMDERYTDLDLEPGSVQLVSHQENGKMHPLVWLRTNGESRLVYDALGHDPRSYESPEHRVLLRQVAQFLVESV
jgi:type 1 glutamine amidotransferase